MALGSHARQNLCNNPPADPIGEQDKLASLQGPIERSDVGSNKALTSSETSTPPFVLPTKNLFTKFMKAFVESIQAQDRKQAEPQKWPLKARSLETYSKKFHMDCYHFCQQYEDHFKTSGTIGMNCTPFAVLFLRSTINLRWAQYKRRHQGATPITWSEFKTFLRKDFGNFQAFINNI